MTEQTLSRKDRILLFVFPLIFKFLLTAIMLTCRVRYINSDVLKERRKKQQPFILTFWHDNVIVSHWCFKYQNVSVMVSKSKDGQIISQCSKHFGIGSVVGSTSSGATRATRQMLKLLRKNKSVAITPDGPRGPRYQLQPGALWIAALSKQPLIPYHIESTKQWQFNSWDRIKLPKPFSTVYVRIDSPYHVDRALLDSEPDTVIAEFEKIMLDNVSATKALLEQQQVH